LASMTERQRQSRRCFRLVYGLKRDCLPRLEAKPSGIVLLCTRLGVFMLAAKPKKQRITSDITRNTVCLANMCPIPSKPGRKETNAICGLYCRIITEGLFGIRPTGLHSFSLTPRLPKEWNEMSLKKMNAFGNSADIEVSRNKTNIVVVIKPEKGKVIRKSMKDGETLIVKL